MIKSACSVHPASRGGPAASAGRRGLCHSGATMNPFFPSGECIQPIFRQISTRFDAQNGVMWCCMNPRPRPCYNPDLLAELKKFENVVERINRAESERGRDLPIRYSVLASKVPGVFNLGGDLDLFLRHIREGNRDGLRLYARACIDVLYTNIVSFNVPITTISLVQGDALGGGFEAALSSNVLVAERSAQFGFPEVLFNLFPGMGAYSLLARRIDAARAERIISSGNTYSAAQLHDMGIVDVLAEDGEGEAAVYDFIARHSRRRNSYQALLNVRRRILPVTLDELMDVTEIWVEAAMALGAKEIRLMERLLKAQDRLVGSASGSNEVPFPATTPRNPAC